MGLQPISARTLRRYNRQFGAEFVHGSAGSSGALCLIAPDGQVYETDSRRTLIRPAPYATTTSNRIKKEQAR